MPEIKSPITNKRFASPQMRSYDVPDAEASTPQAYAESPVGLDLEAANALQASRGLPPLDPAVVDAYNARHMASRAQSPEELDQLEKEVALARRAKVAGKERLSSVAKQRIEILLETSRGVRDVDLDGNVFVLRTIRGKEQRAAFMAASEYDGTVQSPFEIRKQLLARSIASVAGTDIDLFLNDTSIDAKLAFVEELEETMLVKLYDEYLDLVRETQGKYFPKTEAEVKEVVADLGK